MPKQLCVLAGSGRRGWHSHCSSRSAARPLATGSALFSCRKHHESRLPWTAQNRDSSTDPASPRAPVSTSSSHCEKQTENVFTVGAGTDTRARQSSPAQSCPCFKCDQEKKQVKAPLSPSRFPEASRMVFTVSSLPFCPFGVSSYRRPPLSYTCKPRFSLGPSPKPATTPIPPEKSFSAPR